MVERTGFQGGDAEKPVYGEGARVLFPRDLPKRVLRVIRCHKSVGTTPGPQTGNAPVPLQEQKTAPAWAASETNVRPAPDKVI